MNRNLKKSDQHSRYESAANSTANFTADSSVNSTANSIAKSPAESPTTHSPIENISDLSNVLSEELHHDSLVNNVGRILVASGMNTRSARLHSIDTSNQLSRAIAAGLQPEDDFRTVDSDLLIWQTSQALPYASGNYSTVYCAFGCMSVEDAAAAVELLRITEPNGRLVVSSWEPGGVAGELMKLVSLNTELSVFKQRCAYWGTQQGIATLFNTELAHTSSIQKQLRFRFYSPQQWVSLINDFFLPVRLAYASLDHAGVARLTRRLLSHARRLDHSVVTGTEVPMNYMQTVITHQKN